MAAHQVQCLLMGGQACVFYGAAEFSRDSDFAIYVIFGWSFNYADTETKTYQN
jgi:hypothetical protein